jgi:hypothetical protein
MRVQVDPDPFVSNFRAMMLRDSGLDIRCLQVSRGFPPIGTIREIFRALEYGNPEKANDHEGRDQHDCDYQRD